MDLDPDDAPPRLGGNGVTTENGLEETGEYPQLSDLVLDDAYGDGADLDAQASFWLAHLESEAKRLHAIWNRIDAELRRREERIGGLRAELRQRDDELARLRGDLERSTATVRSLEERGVEQDARIHELDEELATARARLAAAEERAAVLADARDDARSEAERLRAELDAREDRIARLEAELDAERDAVSLRARNVQRMTDLRASLAALDTGPSAADSLDAVRLMPLADFASTVACDDGDAPELLPSELLIASADDSADASRAPRHPQLVSFASGEGVAFPLSKDRVTIGRSGSSDICIPSHYVSRIHACVSRQGIATIIEDVGSKNGVRVNGERVKRRILRDGDVVSLGGEVDLKFVDARP